MKKILFILVIFSFNILQAQTLTIRVKGVNTDKALLLSLQGENTTLIDTVKSEDKTTFNYFFDKKKNHAGIYCLAFNQNTWIDFVYDDEDIKFETNADYIFDSLKVKTSLSNQFFYSFIKLNKIYKIKTGLLLPILTQYPHDDNYYKTTLNKVLQLQKEYHNFIKNITKKKPGSFIVRYITSSQLPDIIPDNKTTFNFTQEEQLMYMKTHALDYVNFNDAGLIYSDAFSNKALEYLSYYRDPQLPKEILEKEFRIAVDTILNKAKVHQLVYQHIVEYLISGLERTSFENVLNYIVDNYVIKDELCLDDKTENMIKKRIDQAKKLMVGRVVPNIVLPDSAGNLVDLSKVNTDKILIVFYSSDCPHCQEILPKIAEKYAQQKERKYEIFAISLDTDRNAWLNFIKKNSMTFINVSDLQSWHSKAVMDYYVYATPSIFLVDRDRKIISKASTFEELDKLLQ